MTKTGSVWRVEIVSSTLIFVDDVKKRIQEALENDTEFDEILVEELYESIKLFQRSEDTPTEVEQ